MLKALAATSREESSPTSSVANVSAFEVLEAQTRGQEISLEMTPFGTIELVIGIVRHTSAKRECFPGLCISIRFSAL